MGERILVQGNEAIGRGALAADCRAFFGYPITPQNEVIEWFAREYPKQGRVFLQSASETGSINMLTGGAMTGVRAMTSTSSPGWALMQEGLSNLTTAELPCVIVEVQRGWNTTRHSQTTYKSATTGGGFGDYRTIVLAPDSVQELHDLLQLAFYLADKYRNPVVMLSDAILGQMMEILELKTLDFGPLPEKDWALKGKAAHKDGKKRFTPIAYGMIPTQRHPTLISFLESYKNKINEMEKEVRYATDQLDDAELILVAFGYVARVCQEAILRSRAKGFKVGMIRPITLWPFPTQIIKEKAATGADFLVVEDNLGQMVDDVRVAVEGRVQPHLLSCLARHLPGEEGAIYPEAVVEKIENLLKERGK